MTNFITKFTFEISNYNIYSEQATLLLIQNIHNPSRVTYTPSPLLIKFRGAVNAIIAIQRMRILKNSWGKYKNMKKNIQQQYQRLHKN